MTSNMEPIKPSYVKDLPSDSIDVSDIIDKKVNIEFKDSENEYVKGLNGIPLVHYSPNQKEFYVKRGDYFKILRWRKQKVQNYIYEYVLIPYKRKKPIKILQKYWSKNVDDYLQSRK